MLSFWSKTARRLAAAALTGLMAVPAAHAEPTQINLKVVGTWGYLNQWKEAEAPFWTEAIGKASGGAISVDARPMTDVGLKGFETMRMVTLGIFDVAHGVISYLGDDTVAEGFDLAGVIQDWDDAEKVVAGYKDVLAGRFKETYDVKLLAIYPFPGQFTYCNKPVESPADLKGLKIRSYSKSMSDLITGLGATPVTIAFGEVVPALRLGTVDCAVTGNLPAYVSGWGKVATHYVPLNMGYALSYVVISEKTWAKLNDEAKAIVLDGVANLEKRAWEIAKRDSALGEACLTNGECPLGEAAGLKKVAFTEADAAQLRKVIEASVLSSYAARCDAACVDGWNAGVGAALDLKAAK